MKRLLRVFLPLAMLASSAHAAVITVPTGLAPGAQYRLVFVTSTTRDATSANIADYNSFVTTAANTVPALLALGTTWTAIGSTATVDARDNTGTNPSSTGVPIYLLNDTKLADNNADLWDGSIDTPFGITEQGNTATLTDVWTGTQANGTAIFLGLTTPLGGGVPGLGITLAPNPAWVQFSDNGPFAPAPLYAISGTLTAPVPVPGAVWLLGSALGLMGAMRRKLTA